MVGDDAAGSTDTRQGPARNLSYLVAALWFALAVAAIATAIALRSEWVAAFGVCLLIFSAAFAVGSGLGFLFGIPRVPDRTAPAATPPVPPVPDPVPGKTGPAVQTQVAQELKRRALLNSNTNLERISDWLTTMLVGATLVQLYKINDLLVAFRDFLTTYAKVFSTGLKAPSAGILPAIGPVILVLGLTLGFLFMYLNTRLILIRFFNDVERILSGEEAAGQQKLDRGLGREIQSTLGDAVQGGNFVQQVLQQRRTLSVQDALDLMRDALYRPGGYKSAIEAGGQLSNSSAVKSAWYWYLLAAAFGQKYADEATSDDDRQSAKDNALDAARRAIALNASYRTGLKALTDPRKTDNDLAAVYKDDPRLRDLLDQP
jgi:hypothetical protein